MQIYYETQLKLHVYSSVLYKQKCKVNDPVDITIKYISFQIPSHFIKGFVVPEQYHIPVCIVYYCFFKKYDSRPAWKHLIILYVIEEKKYINFVAFFDIRDIESRFSMSS